MGTNANGPLIHFANLGGIVQDAHDCSGVGGLFILGSVVLSRIMKEPVIQCKPYHQRSSLEDLGPTQITGIRPSLGLQLRGYTVLRRFTIIILIKLTSKPSWCVASLGTQEARHFFPPLNHRHLVLSPQRGQQFLLPNRIHSLRGDLRDSRG